MSVVEFIIQLKGQVKIWLVDYVLRLATPIWGVTGLIVKTVFLGLTTSTVPVSLRPAPCYAFRLLGTLMNLGRGTNCSWDCWVSYSARDLYNCSSDHERSPDGQNDQGKSAFGLFAKFSVSQRILSISRIYHPNQS